MVCENIKRMADYGAGTRQSVLIVMTFMRKVKSNFVKANRMGSICFESKSIIRTCRHVLTLRGIRHVAIPWMWWYICGGDHVVNMRLKGLSWWNMLWPSLEISRSWWIIECNHTCHCLVNSSIEIVFNSKKDVNVSTGPSIWFQISSKKWCESEPF